MLFLIASVSGYSFDQWKEEHGKTYATVAAENAARVAWTANE